LHLASHKQSSLVARLYGSPNFIPSPSVQPQARQGRHPKCCSQCYC
jgi:hypothetical protein